MATALNEDGIDSRLTGLMARYRRLVLSVISSVGGPVLRDSREDVEQQVWVAIWRRLQGDEDIDHPTSYLYAAARHAALRAVKAKLARLRSIEKTPAPSRRPSDDPHLQAVARETGDAIRAAVSKLPPDRRRAMEAYLSGLDIAEMQNLFGWSYERTRNLVSRGRSDLRVLLAGEVEA